MTIENVLGIWQLSQPWMIQGRTVENVWKEKDEDQEERESEFIPRGISKDEIVAQAT